MQGYGSHAFSVNCTFRVPRCSICFFCDVIAAIAGHIPKLWLSMCRCSGFHVEGGRYSNWFKISWETSKKIRVEDTSLAVAWCKKNRKMLISRNLAIFPILKWRVLRIAILWGVRGPSAAVASFWNIQVLSFNLFTEEYPDMRKQDRSRDGVVVSFPQLVCPLFWAMLRFSRLDELVKFGEKVLGDDVKRTFWRSDDVRC